MPDIKVARQRLHDLKREGREKLEAIKAADRLPTEEESEELSAIEAKAGEAATLVEQIEAQMDLERAFSVPADSVSGVISGGTPATDRHGNPWESFGHQLQAIAEAGKPGGNTDVRLFMPSQKAAPQGGGTHQGGEGGFLVQQQFSSEIYRRMYETAVLAGLTTPIPIGEGQNGLSVPYIDETSRATGSRWGGVQVYRANEGDTVTASRPKIGLMETKLEKLMGLAYATEELLQDASAMTAIYNQAFTEEFAFKLDDEIFRGTGAGECLGIKNADATVTVAKETGQAAATIVFENIVKMWSRMWARSRFSAIWVINQDVEPELLNLGITVGTGGTPAYLPPGGLNDAPYGRLFGRPVIPIEHCDTLGTVGDIALIDLGQYQVIDKQGTQFAQSMHVRFIYDEMTFRWTMRVNGQPKWKTALTPYKGSSTKSPFVLLATRS